MSASELVARGQPPDAVAPGGRRWRKRLIVFALLAALAALLVFLLSQAGFFLIVHAPERSDVIVVLDGEWPQAVKLQREGFAPRILLDAGTQYGVYGRTELDLATEFVASMPQANMQICPISGASTFEEVVYVRRCMQALHATSALIVAPNFDTRRVIATFRKRLPQYRWSIAASSNPYRDAALYWKYRRWAKTVLNAWEQFLWWELAERRRPDVVLQ